MFIKKWKRVEDMFMEMGRFLSWSVGGGEVYFAHTAEVLVRFWQTQIENQYNRRPWVRKVAHAMVPGKQSVRRGAREGATPPG